jgi:uncharacterized membrane protein
LKREERKMERPLRFCFVVLALIAGAAWPGLAQDARFTPFDFPGSTFTTARDINPAGEVVGRYGGADGKTHGFLRRRNDEFTSIDVPGADLTAALGNNVGGDVVGSVRFIGEPPSSRHGFLLSDSIFSTIDFPGATTTSASGINPQGEIVGIYTSPDKTTHGYLLSRDGFATIDFPGATETRAWKITRRGRILGAYVDSNHRNHLYVLRKGRFTTINLPEGVIPSLETGGINDHVDMVLNVRRRVHYLPDITGWYCNTPLLCAGVGDIHGFFLRKGRLSVLDVPGFKCVTPLALNSDGDMAGAYSTNSACSDLHAFVLTREDRDREDRDKEEQRGRWPD